VPVNPLQSTTTFGFPPLTSFWFPAAGITTGADFSDHPCNIVGLGGGGARAPKAPRGGPRRRASARSGSRAPGAPAPKRAAARPGWHDGAGPDGGTPRKTLAEPTDREGLRSQGRRGERGYGTVSSEIPSGIPSPEVFDFKIRRSMENHAGSSGQIPKK